MNLRRTTQFLFVFIFFLSACANQAQPIPPTIVSPPPTETSAPPTEAPTEVPAAVPTDIPTEVPSNTDPALFGATRKKRDQSVGWQNL